MKLSNKTKVVILVVLIIIIILLASCQPLPADAPVQCIPGFPSGWWLKACRKLW